MNIPVSLAALKSLTARLPHIAVDGPSGSGKSTVSRQLAALLGGDYVDTGATYRAMTWWMLESGVDIDDSAAVAAAAYSPIIEVGLDPHEPKVFADSRDISLEVRSERVTNAVSRVAAVKEVRQRLIDLQRSYAHVARSQGRACVMEGRDIGTVVLPDAELKIWLTADLEARARRRALQEERGHDADATSTVASSLQSRDERDMTRATSPVARAQDAIVIDATDIDVDAVVAACLLALCDAEGVAYV